MDKFKKSRRERNMEWANSEFHLLSKLLTAFIIGFWRKSEQEQYMECGCFMLN
jgi:hypothetical protein